MSTFRTTFDAAALTEQLGALKQDIQAACRPAAQTAAQLLYEAVKLNVSRIGRKTGNLERSIYQVYSKDQSRAGLATYHVSWNARKAPHGHLIEYGHRQKYLTVIDKRTGQWVTIKSKPLAAPKTVPPRPFVRPAMAQFPAALEAAKQELLNQLKHFK